jgi:hypothetical protein
VYLRQVLDFLIRKLFEAMLSDRWPANVPACIAQEVRLGHGATDEDIPLAFVLHFQERFELFRAEI